MNELTPYQQDMVDKIRALRKLFHETGFRSNKSQTALLGSLNPTDLAAVVQTLQE